MVRKEKRKQKSNKYIVFGHYTIYRSFKNRQKNDG